MNDIPQLNGKKVLIQLLINLAVCSTIALILFAVAKKHDEPTDEIIARTIFAYGIGFPFYLIFLYAGFHTLSVSRRLFDSSSLLYMFDDNKFFTGYLHKESVLYTQECLCGYIQGYPVIMWFNLATSDGETSKLMVDVVVIRFKHPDIEQLGIELDWLRSYQPKTDVKSKVYSFIEDLNAKSAVKGSFEAMVAKKRLSIPDLQTV